MKQWRRVRSAAAKATTKISAPVQKSDTATARRPSSILKKLPNIQKRNKNRQDPNKRTHTQTTSHTKTSQTKSKSRNNLLERSKKNL